MRRPRPLPLWAGLVAAAAIAVVTGAAPAAADLRGPCTATFNGVPVEIIDSLSSPLELDHDAVLTFEGADDRGTEAVRLELVLASFTIDQASAAGAPPGSQFTAALELEEVTPYGVGLYRIRATTDNCVAEGWLRITGRSPLATLAGLTAAGLALGGLLGQGAALFARRRSTPVVAALGGIATGLGGALLGQQFGRLQLSYVSLGIVVSGAAVAGALAGVPFMPRRAGKAPDRMKDRIPHPIAPSPATHTPAGTEAGLPVETLRSAAESGLTPLRLVDTTRAGAPRPARDYARRDADAAGHAFEGEDAPEVARLTETFAFGATAPAPGEPRPEGSPEPGTPTAEPYWCYVMAPVEAFDLRDHTKVVVTLTPGAWYLAKREAGGWAHVVTTTGEEGWVPRRSLHRQG
jgi:hypothetical protein